ncbi:hypothetical protein [Pseudomonas fluorescens]
MTDYTELKRAAEAASQGRWNQDGFDVQNDDIEDYRVSRCNLLADAKFIAAANPVVLKALIAENDSQRKDLQNLRTDNAQLIYALKQEQQSYLVLRAECDQLKAENKRLREDDVRFIALMAQGEQS